MSTKIEWAEDVWNPIRATYDAPGQTSINGKTGWHCERVSEGCQHCYAATINRQRFGTGLDYVRSSREKVEVYLDEKTLLAPLKRRKPTRYFVCSMTDLFGEWVPDEMIDRMFAVMALSPQHTFIVLTKRTVRMREYVGAEPGQGYPLSTRTRVIRQCQQIAMPGNRNKPDWYWPLPNCWLGVSAENQERADERIPKLLATPAAVRFVSAEPLLGPIDLTRHIHDSDCVMAQEVDGRFGCICNDPREDHVSWVIIGGESGTGVRPCNIEWIRAIVQQCQAAGVACFVKQVGSHPYTPIEEALGANGDRGRRLDVQARYLGDLHGRYWMPVMRSLKGGDPEEWSADLRVREFPEVGR